MKSNIDAADLGKSESGLPLGASLLSVFLCILFGANAVAMKISLVGLGPFTTAGIRFGVAAISISIWACLTGKPILVRNGQLYQLAILAPVFFIQLTLFYLGMTKTTASHGTLIVNLLPFIIMLLAHFFIQDERIILRKVFGLVCGFVGILVLFSDAGGSSGDMIVGDLYVFFAVLVWGINAVYTKRIIAGFHPVQVTIYPMMIAFPFFLLCGFIWDDMMIGTVNLEILSALFYQTFVTASFGMVAWASLIRKYGATSLHAFVFIMPLSGVFLGVVLLDEPITIHLVVAVVLVMMGLIIVNREGPDKERKAIKG